mmetsp:Transcript_2943/g.9828  ORF Transcript_2943/g.9828 Transcript_2943/m.9828 type:complete len:121 (+) Transcript_2943:57-419(+)
MSVVPEKVVGGKVVAPAPASAPPMPVAQGEVVMVQPAVGFLYLPPMSVVVMQEPHQWPFPMCCSCVLQRPPRKKSCAVSLRVVRWSFVLLTKKNGCVSLLRKKEPTFHSPKVSFPVSLIQ